MHLGKVGMGLISGNSMVLVPLVSAKEPNRLMNRLSRKGVMNRNIIFLGFLNVRMEFFLIRSPSCPRKPRGGGVFSYSGYSE